MTEIELSLIPDSDVDTRLMLELLESFGRQHNVRVRLRTMTWNNAWNELMTIVAQGRGPHVSHIGATWSSSLMTMNALRPFSTQEIAEIGGATAFMRPAWLNVTSVDDNKVYAIPWSGYLYVICYRKDLLKQVGIQEASAFGSITALHETIQQLAASKLEIPWLNPAHLSPYTDYLHTAASWVWGAGGDFTDEAGKKLIFDEPESLRGLSYWLDTYRAVKPAYGALGNSGAVSLFAQGKVAAVLADIREAQSFVTGQAANLVRENLGVATLTNVPWCSGSNFVIWNRRASTDEEKAAVALVKYLVSSPNQLRLAREADGMPARLGVLQQAYPPDNPLREAVLLAAYEGQAYPNFSLWRKVEFQLAQTLGEMVAAARAEPNKKSLEIAREHIEPLVRRLNLAFTTN